MSVLVQSQDFLFDPEVSISAKPSPKNNIVYGSHKEIYQNLSIVKPLTKAKFPVYLVQSRVTKKNYAMKVFRHENGQPHLYFKNESRFACLQHPNVVRNLYFENQRKSCLDETEMEISYTIMEFAMNGDFFSFLKKQRKHMNEKLARTYFRQLIEGLEYLHNNGVAHMDLKLDNLLIGNDFNLKIADFDMAHFKDDAIIISNGTKYYRAPEVMQGRCNNTKSADIFSAAVVLFTLFTQGVFPQFETEAVGGVEFSKLLNTNPDEFWNEHCKIQNKTSTFFDDDFKELFLAMTKFNPKERASIDTIKASNWYNGKHYTPEELKEKMQRIFTC